MPLERMPLAYIALGIVTFVCFGGGKGITG
jgi:hypothetical protein